MTIGRRRAPAVAGLLALAILLGLRILVPDPFDRLRLAAFDAFQRVHPRERAAPATPVVVVDVDEESLKRHGQWPWSRAVVADLVRALQDADARVIALDMVFAEPDRTSPAQLVPDWERRFGFRRADPSATLPDHDQVLAGAISRGRVVMGFGLLPEANGRSPSTTASIAAIGADPLASVQIFPGAVPNLPALERAAAGHGSFTVSAGHDEIIRPLTLIMGHGIPGHGIPGHGQQLVPSLALEALRVLQDEDTIKVRAELAGGTVTGFTVRVGTIDLPLDAAGQAWLHHPRPRSIPTIPAWRVLNPGEGVPQRTLLAGAAVLVGTSATGLADLRPTPLSAFEPGVNLHAAMIEQALAGRHLVRPASAAGLELFGAALLGGLMILATAFASWRWAALAAALLPPALGLGALALFVTRGVLVDPTVMALGTVVAFAGASLARYAVTERAALRLRSAFTHYLSPDLVAALASDPDRLKLGGESREMTFLFTDLEGFTSLTESRGAEALVTLLNAYLDGLCRIATEHGGTVDKIVGDAVHVMWNAPLSQPDHAARAVACALALDAFAQGFAAEQVRAGVAFGVTRIGVNTGTAVVGNFGGARRFDYTAHGDAINTAARLEAANKALGTRICVARSTVEQVHGIGFRPIGTLLLRGKTVGVEVFEPSPADAADLSWRPRYLDAFARLVGGDETGARDLLRLHQQHPDDAILSLHARRIRDGERSTRLAA